MSTPMQSRNGKTLSVTDATIDLSTMAFRVGPMPYTLAECVGHAVRMWSGKYHNPYFGANRDAELLSIVWETMRTAPAHATPSSVAHWSCLTLINERHMHRRKGQGKCVDRQCGQTQHDINDKSGRDAYLDQRDPADSATSRVDWDALYASLTKHGQTVMDLLVAGYIRAEIMRLTGMNWQQWGRVLLSLRSKYQTMHFSTPATATLIRELLDAAVVAA